MSECEGEKQDEGRHNKSEVTQTGDVNINIGGGWGYFRAN